MKKIGRRHSPNRFTSYCEIHETVINKFRDSGFIGDHNLKFEKYFANLHLSGAITCLGEILISVDKLLKKTQSLENDFLVQTTSYVYNVFIQNNGNILRYDNQHPQRLHPGCHDPHHKHIYDWRLNVEESGSPYWVGEGGWPTLGDVIEEVEAWYWENSSFLPNPNRYAALSEVRTPPSLEL